MTDIREIKKRREAENGGSATRGFLKLLSAFKAVHGAGYRQVLRAARAFHVVQQMDVMESDFKARGVDVAALKNGNAPEVMFGSVPAGGLFGGKSPTPPQSKPQNPDDAALTRFGEYFALAQEKSATAKTFYAAHRKQIEAGRTIALKALRAEVSNITNYTDRTVAMQGVAELERI
jgi:hypothetical protein